MFLRGSDSSYYSGHSNFPATAKKPSIAGVRGDGFRCAAKAAPPCRDDCFWKNRAGRLAHRMEFHRLCEARKSEDAQNEIICADVLGAVREGRSPLLLAERIEHVQCLAHRLSGEIPHVITLQGGNGTQRNERHSGEPCSHSRLRWPRHSRHGTLRRRRI